MKQKKPLGSRISKIKIRYFSNNNDFINLSKGERLKIDERTVLFL